jgi:twitching motility protein PilI
MSENRDALLSPEEALNRFQKPDTALLGLDISSHDYIRPRYGFKVNSIGLLISPDALCEVKKNFIVYPVPKTKQWFQGLVNIRGNLIPVYDLSIMLGTSDVPTKHENLLVIDKGSDSVGILIDDIPQHCDTNDWIELSQVPVLPSGLSESVDVAYTKNDTFWLEFDHKKFFSALVNSIAH